MFKLVMRNGVAVITIYNDIDSYFGFSAQDLREELKKLDAKTELHVKINSIGGEVFQGLAIYNALRQWEGKVVTICEGIAASIASVIFLAGDERHIADNAMVMVHDPMISAIAARKEELEDLVELLEKTKSNVTNIYTSRTGASSEAVNEWLSKDTYFLAQEALDNGFATKVISLDKAVASANVQKLVAKLITSTGVNLMFEQWLKEHCELLGVDPSSLSNEQRTKLEAKFKEMHPKPPSRNPDPPNDPPTPPTNKGLDAGDIEMIRELEEDYKDAKLDTDYLKEIGCRRKTVRGLISHAIRKEWSYDKTELELRRAERRSVGHVGIHSAPNHDEVMQNGAAISCALVRNAGIAASKKHAVSGEKWGYEHWYKQETLEASDNPRIREMGLTQLLEHHIIAATGSRYEGRTNTDGFISAVRDAMFKLKMSGNTTWTGLNIFDDAANKMLWAAYESQNTTWQEWVKEMPVNDFKTHNAYRLTSKGGYRQVGADGELKYGGFTDDKYTYGADTYGKLVGLTRRDIINDDLGALNTVMTMLGEDGAKFLEELFYVHLLNQLTTLFPTNDANNNYISGASSDLGVDGLTLAENKMADQVDADGSPILVEASLLLHGTQDTVIAGELFSESALRVLQTANSKGRPDNNPHVGKYRPIKGRYLSNTNILQRIASVGQAVPNQTSDQWLMLRTPGPSGGIVIGSFLNGNTRPIIEQGDPGFEVLGLQWRAYHDAGADNGDPKWGVYSKGAA